MSAADDLKALEAKLEELSAELKTACEGRSDKAAIAGIGGGTGKPGIKIRRKLAFEGKVSEVHWWTHATDNEHLLSVMQDGKIVVWNGATASKAYFAFQNTWLMTGQFAPDGTKIAVAGLDNKVTIHDCPDFTSEGFEALPQDDKVKEMEKHGGYIGSLKWLSNSKVISGSGDKTIMLWDISKDMGVQKEPENTFIGHGLDSTKQDAGDVAALDVLAGEENTFISGASDHVAKLWDTRLPNTGNQCALSFHGHSNSINKIKYLPGGDAFVTASDDGSLGVFSIKAGGMIQCLKDGKAKATSVTCSKTGRYIFGGFNDGSIKMFDLLNVGDPDVLSHHTEDVTSIDVSPDGKALASTARSATNNFCIWS